MNKNENRMSENWETYTFNELYNNRTGSSGRKIGDSGVPI
jgi:hypothetical protein